MTDEIKEALRQMKAAKPEASYATLSELMKAPPHQVRLSRETIKAFFRAERMAAPKAEAPAEAPTAEPAELEAPTLTPEEIQAVTPAPAPASSLPASAPIPYSLSEPAPKAAAAPRAPVGTDDPSQKELREASEAVAEMIMMSHGVILEKIGAPLTDAEKEMGKTCWFKVARYYMPKMSEGTLALLAVGSFEATIIGTRLDKILPGKLGNTRAAAPAPLPLAAPAAVSA